MPDGAPSSVGSRRRRTATTILVLAGCCVLLPVILVAAALVALSAAFANLNFDFSTHRAHLKPIPIAADACPYVHAMHQAAHDYEVAFPFPVVPSTDANGRPLPWPTARARIGNAADVLEYSIIVSSSHFPAPVQRYLATVRRDLDAGREQLGLARDGMDLSGRVLSLQSDGQQAFGYASDLIGTQCGEPLGV